MIDAVLLVQDVQLLCFAIIFGFVTWQHRRDRTRRWFWYSFLANAVGAILDFATPHIPPWLGRGLNMEMIPLSYALVTVSIVFFVRRHRWAIWLTFIPMAAALPLLLLWSANRNQVPTDALTDLVIGLQTALLAYTLTGRSDEATRPARITMSLFFALFSLVELFRAAVYFVLHHDPDLYPRQLAIISSVAYIVSTSVLPLAFIWMLNSRLESELILQTMIDPLTNVLNRRGLRHALDREVAQSIEAHTTLTVAMLDVDHFKQFNDTHGHATGDACLISLANLLQNALRDTDTVARIGGEEFVLLLPSTTQLEAEDLLERLRHQVETSTDPTETACAQVTASFGATTTRGLTSVSPNDLLREADTALYRAKQEGRNRVRFFRQDESRANTIHAERYAG